MRNRTYVIRGFCEDTFGYRLIARFTLTRDGQVVFDRTCGDRAAVDALVELGIEHFDVSAMRTVCVRPSDGDAFVDACLLASDIDWNVNDQAELAADEARYPSPHLQAAVSAA